MVFKAIKLCVISKEATRKVEIRGCPWDTLHEKEPAKEKELLGGAMPRSPCWGKHWFQGGGSDQLYQLWLISHITEGLRMGYRIKNVEDVGSENPQDPIVCVIAMEFVWESNPAASCHFPSCPHW